MLAFSYFLTVNKPGEKDLREVKDLVLAATEKTKSYVGKGNRTALDFTFSVQGSEQQLKFRVFPDDDPDGKKYVNSWDFSAGSGMDVMMDKKDALDFENKISKGPFKVYNVKLHGIWLVSPEQTERDHKKMARSFTVTSCCLIAVGLVLFFYSRRSQNKQ